MKLTFKELCTREVICMTDGARLGFINDLEFSPDCCTVCAYLLPSTAFLSFSNKPKYRIECNWVERFGEDIILVRRYQVLSNKK